MPPVVAYVAAALVEIGLSTAVATWAANFLVSTALSFVVSAVFSKSAKGSNISGRTQTVRSSVQPRNHIYGEAMTSGPLVFAGSSDKGKEKNKYMHIVIALAAHEVHEIGEVYLGDDPVGELDASGFPVGGKFIKSSNSKSKTQRFQNKPIGTTSVTLSETPASIVSVTIKEDDWSTTIEDYTFNGATIMFGATEYAGTISVNYLPSTSGAALVRIKKHLGKVDQLADADLIAEMPEKWTVAHRLQGIAYLYVRLEYDASVFASGLPNIKTRVKGKPVLDPRTGQIAYSTNWALCVYDYLRSDAGFACEADDVDEDSVITAANISDEDVQLQEGTQKRYVCNGMVTEDVAPDENLKNMITAGAGAVVLAGGVLRVFAGAYDIPTVTLTESDLRGSIKVSPRLSRRDLFNTVKGTYVDGDGGTWQEVDFPAVTSDALIEQDAGEKLTRDVKYPCTTDYIMAQRLAKITLEKARRGVTVEFPAKLTAFQLAAWDTVRLKIDKFGWDGKVFRVLSWKFSQTGGIDLVLQEEDAAAYQWNMGEITIVDDPTEPMLPPTVIPAPKVLVLESGQAHVLQLADGTIIPRIFAQWDTDDAALYRQGGKVEIEYKPADSETWTPMAAAAGDAESAYIQPVIDGETYNVRIRLVTSTGAGSLWTYGTHTAGGKTDAPANALQFSAKGGLFCIYLSWIYPVGADIAKLEIYGSESNNFATASHLVDIAYPSTTWTHAGLEIGQTVYYWARLVNTSGIPGEYVSIVGRVNDSVAEVVEALSGSITESQLFNDLRTKIGLITDGKDVIGSVNERLGILEELNDLTLSAVKSMSAARTVGATSEAERIDSLIATTQTGVLAEIARVQKVLADADEAMASDVSQMTAQINDPNTGLSKTRADILTEQQVRATAVSAVASQITTLQSTVNGQTASIQTLQSVTNGISGEYYVKIDANGRVAGFGLSNDSTTGSLFAIAADRFLIGSGSGASTSPFMHLSTAQTIDGVTYPAGTYLKNAFIGDLTVDTIKIKDGAVTNMAYGTGTSGTFGGDAEVSVTITTTGKPVIVSFYAELSETDSDGGGLAMWRLTRNGALIRGGNSSNYGGDGQPSGMFVDALPAGTYTYRLYDASIKMRMKSPTISIIENKK